MSIEPPMPAGKPMSPQFVSGMAMLIVALSYPALGFLLWLSDPKDRPQLIMAAFVFLTGTCLSTVIYFVFGSSRGSDSKQQEQERRLDSSLK